MPSLFENENTKKADLKEESIHDKSVYTPVAESLKLAERLRADIDNYCIEKYNDPFRWRLGASVIGHDCKRYLWYSFRWCKAQAMEGWQARISDRGNREEARFIEWLRGIGCQVWAFDETGRQYSFSSVMGHFGGSLDSVIQLPESYKFHRPMLAEYKTNNTGKGFNDLTANGVQKSKPIHWAQDCTYGYKLGLNHLAYFNINKNDDTLHIEVLPLDPKLGKQMEDKAEIIIRSQTAPARLSDNPNHFQCNFCNMKGICHNNETIEKNCRSCSYASPVDNGEWFCSLPAHSSNIPRSFVESRTGCDSYISIVSN